eukprot:EG_transcript_672
MAELNTLHVPVASPRGLFSPHGPAVGSVQALERRRWSNPEPGAGLLGQLRLRAVIADDASVPSQPRPWASQSQALTNLGSLSPKTPSASVANMMHHLRSIQRLAHTLEVEVAAAGVRHGSTTAPDTSLASHDLDGTCARLIWLQHTAGVMAALGAVLWLPIALCAGLAPWAALLGLGLILFVQLCDLTLWGSCKPSSCLARPGFTLDLVSLLTVGAEFPVYCLGPGWLLPLLLQGAGAVQCARYAEAAARLLPPALPRWCGWGACRRHCRLSTGVCIPAALCLVVAWVLGITAIRHSFVNGDLVGPAHLLLSLLASSSNTTRASLVTTLASTAEMCPSLASVSVDGELVWTSSRCPTQCFSLDRTVICFSIGSAALECALQAAALVGLFALAICLEVCGGAAVVSGPDKSPPDEGDDELLRRGDETPSARWFDDWLHTISNTVSDLQGQVCAMVKVAHSSLAEPKPWQDLGKLRADFLMAMSHELRTPVAGLIGHAEVLQMSPLSDSQRHSARVIQLCGEALLQRVGDILHYCQLCDTAVVLDVAPFVVRQLLEDVVAVAERSLVEKGLRATIHLDGDVPIRLMGDVAKLQQTLMNLVNNAIRFTLPDGDVCICVRRTVRDNASEAPLPSATPSRVGSFHLPAHPDKGLPLKGILRRPSRRIAPAKSPSNHPPTDAGTAVRRVSIASLTTVDEPESSEELALRFEVIDTGVGIPAAQQERVFEPFSQVDQSATRRYDGCGLGLSICKSLVHAMQGRISIQSPAALPARPESKMGTKVWFTVPLHCVRGEEALTERTDTDPQLYHNLLAVLVLLDDQLALQLREMLAGLHVRWEETTLEGLQSVVEGVAGPVMLIVDEDVPGLAASTCATELRSADLALVLTNGHRVEPNTTAKPPSRSKLRQWIDGVRSQQLLEEVLSAPPPAGLPAAGSTLCFSPRAGDAASGVLPSASPLPFPPGPAYAPPAVVVAEDSPLLQQLMRAHIERLGHQVVLCSSGQEVLDCLEKTWYPLVFMDYHMPDMDGLQCTRIIRRWEREGRFPPHPPIYIVGVTADVLMGTKQACLDAGMNCYMSKPVQSHQLAAVLRCLAVPSPTASPIVAGLPAHPPSPLLLPRGRGPIRLPSCGAIPPALPFLLSEGSSEFDPVMPESSQMRSGRRPTEDNPPLLNALRALVGTRTRA